MSASSSGAIIAFVYCEIGAQGPEIEPERPASLALLSRTAPRPARDWQSYQRGRIHRVRLRHRAGLVRRWRIAITTTDSEAMVKKMPYERNGLPTKHRRTSP